LLLKAPATTGAFCSPESQSTFQKQKSSFQRKLRIVPAKEGQSLRGLSTVSYWRGHWNKTAAEEL